MTQSHQPVEWFDNAYVAMKAGNRNRALSVENFKIQDDTGAVLTDRKLAMLVMDAQLRGLRQEKHSLRNLTDTHRS